MALVDFEKAHWMVLSSENVYLLLLYTSIPGGPSTSDSFLFPACSVPPPSVVLSLVRSNVLLNVLRSACLLFTILKFQSSHSRLSEACSLGCMNYLYVVLGAGRALHERLVRDGAVRVRNLAFLHRVGLCPLVSLLLPVPLFGLQDVFRLECVG